MRTSLSLIIGTALMFLVSIWMISPDQAFAQRAGHESFRASTHASGALIGRPVRSERGVVLGTVENIVLNDNGCAQFVVISGRFPGARSMWYPIPWNVIARSTPEAIFVNIEPDVLVRAPSFSRNRFPDLLHSDFNARVNTFFQTTAKEEKGRAERSVKERGRDWESRATQGVVSPTENVKDKARMERERKFTPSEMKGEGISKQKEMDIKSRGHMEREKGAARSGKSEMMMERGPSHMERGSSENAGQRQLQNSGPGHAVTPAQPGQPGEKIH
ncbi:MAG TPA: PRC-barrel domain-containing protein [Desulfomonilaceae bacterium]|nr:PRC-barrel domain-containing protein [Desulfomonilaceae bacterium]